ncbi:hypothetical protein KFE25_014012 [Diacronema lutheri]|uniref:PAS domain-containing protein n=2 Tax=Diacronema lutheri TaxID=2081491 RepID=A0A8J6CBZ3_DIALT|nr:hypothetical protein KFE25_014012 [Diacronema lutheri]
MDDNLPGALPGQAAIYDDIDHLVQHFGWSAQDLEDLDPEGRLQLAGDRPYASPLGPPPPHVADLATQQQAAAQYGGAYELNGQALMAQGAISLDALLAPASGGASVPASASDSGSIAATGPASRRRSAEVDGAVVQRTLEEFRPFSPGGFTPPPTRANFLGRAPAQPVAHQPPPLHAALHHPQPQHACPPLFQPPHAVHGPGCCSQPLARLSSPGGSGSPHLLQRPSHPSTPSSSRTPSDCSDPTAQLAAAGNFFWERCAVEGSRLTRLTDAVPPGGAGAAGAGGGGGGGPPSIGQYVGGVSDGSAVSIGEICMVRPFMQSQSMLHYWFRTWKVPRITISVANARSAGAGCTICLHAITVSAPSDTITPIEMRGTTRMPLVGGQATFSGLMFGTTSYSHSNNLFHLLATIECAGRVVDGRISTGLHVFSKNKQRAGTHSAGSGAQPARPRTGSQFLETAGGNAAGPWSSCCPSSSHGGSELTVANDLAEGDEWGSPVATGGGPADGAGYAGGGGGGGCGGAHLGTPYASELALGARGSPKRRTSESPVLLANMAGAASACRGGEAFGGAPFISDVKRQRSANERGSPLGSPRVGSPASLGSPLQRVASRERAPSIYVHDAEDGPACAAMGGAELDGYCCADGSRRVSATGMPPRTLRPARSPLGHDGAGNALLSDNRSRRASDSGTSPGCARRAAVEVADEASRPPPPPPLRLRVQVGADGGRRFAPVPPPPPSNAGAARAARASADASGDEAEVPSWLVDEEACHCLRGSRLFTVALHVATGTSAVATPHCADGAAAQGADARARPDEPRQPADGQRPSAVQRHALGAGEGATQPPPSPLAISVRYVSTNLDDELGRGGSLAGAVGLPVSALFCTDDAQLIAAALGELWPSWRAPSHSLVTHAGALGDAHGAPVCAGGSVDLGERTLRAHALPGAYAGLRVHAVLLCTPPPPAADAPDAPLARPHVTLACRALAPGEVVGTDGARGGEELADAPGCHGGAADSASAALSVLAECGDVIARLDAQMRVCYISPNCYELVGYAPHELLGLELTAAGWLMHADDARQLRAAALDPAHRAAAEAQVATRALGVSGGKARRRPPAVRLRSFARLGCRASAALSWAELVLTHTYGPASFDESAGASLVPALEAITVSMREQEWRRYEGASPAGALGGAHAGADGAGVCAFGRQVSHALPGAASSSPSAHVGGVLGLADDDMY